MLLLLHLNILNHGKLMLDCHSLFPFWTQQVCSLLFGLHIWEVLLPLLSNVLGFDQIYAGALIGLLQLPSFLLINNGLGCSSGYVSLASSIKY